MRKGRPRIVNRARLHRLLQQEIKLASPDATRFLAAGLERIATHITRRSGQVAARAGRRTIKPRDVEQAWNEFTEPRQLATWTADELAQLIERLHRRAKTAGENLASDAGNDEEARR